MKKSKQVIVADLFCGAGGTSTGLRQACERQGIKLTLIAVNHWEIAISTHTANHPEADHLCAPLESLDPRRAVPNGKLDLLIASPECIHHSNARGGKPINDQSRASAWRVVEWLSQIQVENALIENVPEFRGWGPLIEKKVEKTLTLPGPELKFEKWYAKVRRNGGTLEEWKRIYRDLQGSETSGCKVKRQVKITMQVPDPKRKGEIYISFLKAIESHGYTVDTRIINAADFGDPTSRERLFIRARRGRKPIRWPEPTHAPTPKVKVNGNGNGNGHRTLFDMTSARPSYRTAREIIDWDIPGESIFTRKRPLAPNTMSKIWTGLEKVCGLSVLSEESGSVDSFMVKYYGGHDIQLLDEPLPAITANYEHYGLATPYIVELRNGQDVRSIDEPLTTITTKGMHHAVCRPYIVVLRNNVAPRSIDEPLATVSAGGSHHAICQPFVLVNRNNNAPKSVDEPVPALCTGNHMYLVKPYIIPVNHGANRRPRGVDEPMSTITTFDAFGLVKPFIINSGGREIAPRSADEPLNTVMTRDHLGVVQPFIISTEHGGHTRTFDQPLNTITAARGGAHGVGPYLLKYYGTAGAQSVDEPLDTVTSKDRFALVMPALKPGYEIAMLEILFRMLQPHELARAMGFPKTYFFFGNREQKVRQIGNAVAVGVATALCQAILQDV